MKVNENFVLRQVADIWVVLPMGEKIVDFTGMLTLNETGALLWKLLETGADREGLVKGLTAEYAVPEDRARTDVDAFLGKLAQIGCLDME